jgi:hypothetical protein
MKNETPAAPQFDAQLAQAVPPTRHEPTARTFTYVQGAHLFSATRDFIATDPKLAAAILKPAAK